MTTGALLFGGGIYTLALSWGAQNAVVGVSRVIAMVGAGWLAFRVVDVLSEIVLSRQHTAAAFVPVTRRVLKIVSVAVTLIAALQSVGFNATSLLAGLGIGGLAVALAGQKTVEQFFGSVTLIADQPVRVGDHCRFGDKVGVIEDIGLRSTRVRTPERTVISIPNAEFASMQLENLSRRDRFRLQATIGLKYDTTPEQLRTVLNELRKILRNHPKVQPDPVPVRFTGFGTTAFRIEMVGYVMTRDIDEFRRVREDIFLQVMDIVTAAGTKLATTA